MASPKAYDVLVSGVWRAKWIVCCWAKTVLFQNFQNSLIWVRKMSKRKTEKEKNICLYRGIEWETRRQMGQQGETERGRGRGWELWEQRGLLPTRYSVVHVWVSSKVYLIFSYQAELCNSKQIKTEFSDIILTKVCFFLSWEKMLSLWFVFVLCN